MSLSEYSVIKRDRSVPSNFMSDIEYSVITSDVIKSFDCIVIILMGRRELLALLGLSSWCLVVVELLFLAVPRGCLRFVIVVFPDHTHLLFSDILVYFYFAQANCCDKF